jgi:hypothetical protein
MAFYQECDGRRSRRALPATVESLDETRVGTRRVGVRFLERPGGEKPTVFLEGEWRNTYGIEDGI